MWPSRSKKKIYVFLEGLVPLVLALLPLIVSSLPFLEVFLFLFGYTYVFVVDNPSRRYKILRRHPRLSFLRLLIKLDQWVSLWVKRKYKYVVKGMVPLFLVGLVLELFQVRRVSPLYTALGVVSVYLFRYLFIRFFA